MEIVIFKSKLYLISGSKDASICIWDLESKKLLWKLKEHKRKIFCIKRFKKNGNLYFASAGIDEEIIIWELAGLEDLELPKPKFKLYGHTKSIYSLKVLKIGFDIYLASAGEDLNIIIWDLKLKKPYFYLKGHTKPILAMATVTIPNSFQTLASAGGENIVFIWDLDTKQPMYKLSGHTNTIFTLKAFTIHDKPVLASGGGDNMILIWNLSNLKKDKEQKEIIRICRQTGFILSFDVIIEDDGKQSLVSGSYDKSILVSRFV